MEELLNILKNDNQINQPCDYIVCPICSKNFLVERSNYTQKCYVFNENIICCSEDCYEKLQKILTDISNKINSNKYKCIARKGVLKSNLTCYCDECLYKRLKKDLLYICLISNYKFKDLKFEGSYVKCEIEDSNKNETVAMSIWFTDCRLSALFKTKNLQDYTEISELLEETCQIRRIIANNYIEKK